jgi:hypothetical protein
MEEILLEIGSDQNKIWLKRFWINSDLSFYRVEWTEFCTIENDKSLCFISLIDAWTGLKTLFPKWHKLSVIKIDCQMTDLLKNDYFSELVKDNSAMDTWLMHLIGHGIGF